LYNFLLLYELEASNKDKIGIMTEGMREIHQLWFIALHYFRLSKRMKRSLSRNLLNKITMQDIADRLSNPADIFGDTKRLMLLTAHLSSCATRLNTIEFILGKNSRRLQMYNRLRDKKSNLTQQDLETQSKDIVHFLLRNTVGHGEPGGSSRPEYLAMEAFLKSRTAGQLFDDSELLIEDMKQDNNIWV